MNSLNSVLLEGTVKSIDRTDDFGMEMVISTPFNFRTNGIKENSTKEFSVVVYSELADKCFKHLEIGRGIRAVGSLNTKEVFIEGSDAYYPKVYVDAEHIEFKNLGGFRGL